MKNKKSKHPLTYVVLVIFSIFTLIPFFLVIITSLKNMNDIVVNGPLSMPRIIRWENYIKIWKIGNMVPYLKNSIIVTIICILCILLLALLASYAFAYLKFKGKGFFLTLILLELMIPTEVLMEEVLVKVKAAELDMNEENKVKKLDGFISTQVFIVDYKTQVRRYGLLDDVMKGIALVDCLDNIPRCDAVVIPSDIPYNMTDVVSFPKIYGYSRKPGGTYILSPVSSKYIMQMAEVMNKKVSYLLETVSPLQFRKESLEIALVFAKRGQLMHMGPMVISGATGPVTLAGTVTLHNAEVLASLFMINALTNNFADYCAASHTLDLKTMLCSFGSPNQALLGICTAQLGRFYGLRTISNSGLTDALVPDFQGGFEKASTAVFSCLAGSGGIGCQGIVGADQGISLEQLVIDNEWLDAYNYILGGVEVNEETIAADIIESIGIAGNFIAEEHTAIYMRDNYWPSRIFNRDNWDIWKSRGSKDVLDKAHEFVQSAVADYKQMTPVISQSKLDEIDYIVKYAEEELSNERRLDK